MSSRRGLAWSNDLARIRHDRTVRRGDDGIARIVGAGHRAKIWEAPEWARYDRATELQLYHPADFDRERDAIVEDLIGDDAL